LYQYFDNKRDVFVAFRGRTLMAATERGLLADPGCIAFAERAAGDAGSALAVCDAGVLMQFGGSLSLTSFEGVVLWRYRLSIVAGPRQIVVVPGGRYLVAGAVDVLDVVLPPKKQGDK
jgi:hypothetical protein